MSFKIFQEFWNNATLSNKEQIMVSKIYRKGIYRDSFNVGASAVPAFNDIVN